MAKIVLSADDEKRVQRILATTCDLRTNPLTSTQLSLLSADDQEFLDRVFKRQMGATLKALLMIRAIADYIFTTAPDDVREGGVEAFLGQGTEAVMELFQLYDSQSIDYDDIRMSRIFDLFDLSEIRQEEFDRWYRENNITLEIANAMKGLPKEGVIEPPPWGCEHALFEPVFDIMSEARREAMSLDQRPSPTAAIHPPAIPKSQGTNGNNPPHLQVVGDSPRERFARHLLKRGKSPVSVQTYLAHLTRLERFTGKRFTTDLSQELTPADFNRFIDEADFSPWTVRATLSGAKAWRRWGYGESLWTVDDGSESAIVPSLPESEIRPLSAEQARELMWAASTPTQVRLVYQGLLAGCRVGESSSMHREHVLKDKPALGFVGKGRKYREVPIHSELAPVLGTVFFRGPYADRSYLEKQARILGKKVGFHFTTHQLRKTFSDTLLDKEVPLYIVEALMGHAPTSTTLQSYARIPFRQKVEAISRLSY